MFGRSYRPRPDNGSGDSPRPPFLTEFVNQIGKLTLIELVYHLFGGQLGHRVHPHVERSVRLKTKSPCCVVELQAADAKVGENSVSPQLSAISKLRKRPMPQLDRRPIPNSLFAVIPSEADGFALRIDLRNRGTCFSAKAWGLKPEPCSFQRLRILIEANQTTRCAEASCDFVTVPAQAHRGVDIGPATPHG